MKINDGQLVAKVRATRKGKTMQLGSETAGGKGLDGRKWYEIRKASDNRWTCSCMAYRFTKGEVGRKVPCKHMKKLKVDWIDGRIDDTDTLLYNAALMA